MAQARRPRSDACFCAALIFFRQRHLAFGSSFFFRAPSYFFVDFRPVTGGEYLKGFLATALRRLAPLVFIVHFAQCASGRRAFFLHATTETKALQGAGLKYYE